MKAFLIAVGIACLAAFVLLLAAFAHRAGVPVLVPSGSIGVAERDLMLHALYLMLIVVVPVFLLAGFIAWHYRESNSNAAYTPEWEHSKMEEFIWWSVPLEIILVLSALTWSGTHELDPPKAIASTIPPLTIEVVALPWKWLFIYPDQGIASVGEVALPVDRPVTFKITADAPMNSFWIPALGGQMYAMTGMTTTLNLMATAPGAYAGQSANYSGDGFAGMQFTARALSGSDFSAWVARAASSTDALTPDSYVALRKPGDAGPVRYYGTVRMTFADIIALYMPFEAHHH